MSVKTDLIAARALIEAESDWSPSGAYTIRNGRMAICTWMALHKAINTTGERLMAGYDSLLAALPWHWRLRARFSQDMRDAWIIRFNDHPKTTHADIMALFDRAIEAAE